MGCPHDNTKIQHIVHVKCAGLGWGIGSSKKKFFANQHSSCFLFNMYFWYFFSIIVNK